MIYSNNTYDITNDISTYTRTDFKQVYDTSALKWYMLNNLNQYEEYGIYGDSLSGTYYTGKLVIVNDHEYEWNGTEWDDLGEFVEQIVAIYRDSTHTGNIIFPQYIRNMSSFSATFKATQSGGGIFLGSNGLNDASDWRMFFYTNKLHYDCSSDRTTNSQVVINNTYNLLFGGNPMKLTNLTTGTVMYTGNVNRPSSGDYNFLFGGLDQYGGSSSADYGYLYDLVLYSDNDGQNAIAHYIPYIQNDTVGMYDTINEVFVAATGTIGAEIGSARPKEYATKTTPTIVSKWPSVMYTGGHYVSKLYRNDTEQAILDYMSDSILEKGDVKPPFKYEFVDFSMNDLNNTTPFYGFMVKSDYVSHSSYFDICFGTYSGVTGTVYIPRICLDYNGGAYTDTGFLDKPIKSLSTILYNGDTYYYAEFVQTSYYNKDRTVSGSSGMTSNVAEAERTLKLITKINN